MKWSEESKAKQGVSYYDHVIAETPIGRMIIEWKSWKENSSYDVMLDDKWIGVEYDLESAKQAGRTYLKDILNKLDDYLSEK